MHKINLMLAGTALLLAVAGAAWAQVSTAAGARKDSINTVDELLKIENIKALVQSRKDAQALGLAPAADPSARRSGATVEQRPASLYVESISGVADELRVDLSYSGMRFERARLGARVGPCEIQSIRGRRVTLVPAVKNTRGDQCPSAEWTGGPNPADLIAARLNEGSAPGSSVPMGVPMPMPAPMPAGAVNAPSQAPGAMLPALGHRR